MTAPQTKTSAHERKRPPVNKNDRSQMKGTAYERKRPPTNENDRPQTKTTTREQKRPPPNKNDCLRMKTAACKRKRHPRTDQATTSRGEQAHLPPPLISLFFIIGSRFHITVGDVATKRRRTMFVVRHCFVF
ncbi:hypothetical protein K443DRAFT_104750 [Laccaria amethystina LaAM-08-1]|uniref:Uncharacterized protein n=1 Tax=Laccaria amethystina LaAM-08-1 TaxID=1095629 RepID=A0A0C9WM90_9AGAR|nr:hypothetical protein K443DRAFT_104750 [Laccaria amethystina LaAM-08-1]